MSVLLFFCVLLISRHRTDRQCSCTNLVLETASEWAPGTRRLTFHQSLLNTEENVVTRRSSVQAQRRVSTSEKKNQDRKSTFRSEGHASIERTGNLVFCLLSMCVYSALKSPLNIFYTKSTVS